MGLRAHHFPTTNRERPDMEYWFIHTGGVIAALWSALNIISAWSLWDQISAGTAEIRPLAFWSPIILSIFYFVWLVVG